MSKSVTLVSALYQIGRNRWKYSGFPSDYDRYRDWIKNLLSIDSPLYLFTDKHYYDHVVAERKKYDPNFEKTVIKKIPFDQLYFYQKYYLEESCLMNSPQFRNKIFHLHTADMNYPLYHIVNFSKIEFVKQASDENKFNATHFFWVDAGGFREKRETYENKKWPVVKDDIFNDKITHFTHNEVIKIEPSKDDYFRAQIRNIQGTAWVVPKEMVNNFFQMIDNQVNTIINEKIVGSDEKVYDFLYTTNPELYQLKKCGWFKFYDVCDGVSNTENNVPSPVSDQIQKQESLETPKHSSHYSRLKQISGDTLAPAHKDYLVKMRDQFDITPLVIYDVGACVLNWTNAANRVWPNSQVFLFDAMEESEEIFKEYPYPYAIEVLSDTDGKEVVFYKNADFPWGNSYYKENEKHSHAAAQLFNRPQNQFVRKAITLDTLRKTRNFPYPDLLKLDVQGCEIDILRGATDILQHAKHLIIELQNVEYNIGAKLVDESLPIIESMGFELVTPRFASNVVDADYHFKKKSPR